MDVPTELFQMDVVHCAQSNDYGVTADGRRFLVKVPAGEAGEPRIHVATHWPSLLEGW